MNFGNLRVLVLLVVFLLVGIVQQLRKVKKKGKITENLDEYEKNGNGLYPWEVDTDDSPNRIPADAKRFIEKDKIRRGKW